MSDFVWSYMVVPVAIISMVIIGIKLFWPQDYAPDRRIAAAEYRKYMKNRKNRKNIEDEPHIDDWLFERGIPYLGFFIFIIYLAALFLDFLTYLAALFLDFLKYLFF
ncbi:hypothetical protein ACFFHT_00325 [Gallibacterium melopsittaci]|uniref:Uncharacterized protein n=1 Tax=Gallibacterium melopsittaci TaxID=516063 RepID=A0ABV6HT22_9PAST